MTESIDNIQSVAELYEKRNEKTDRIRKTALLPEEEWLSRDRSKESAEDEMIMEIFRAFVKEWEKEKDLELKTGVQSPSSTK